MTAERKNLKSDIDTIERILHLLNYKKEVFMAHSNEGAFNHAVEYVQGIIDQATSTKRKLPIGHQYTGEFYLKKANTIPYESIKITGSAFMREDLVSWVIDSEDNYAKNLYYVRDIYKDSRLKNLIKREEGEAVFEKPKIR